MGKRDYQKRKGDKEEGKARQRGRKSETKEDKERQKQLYTVATHF